MNFKSLLKNLELGDIHLKNLSKEDLLYRALPHFFLELLEKYFRLEVEGIENLPLNGSGIVAPNHSGFSGLDAMLLSYIIQKHRERLARVLTHQFWFLTKTTSLSAKKYGFVEATKVNGMRHLKNKELIVVFPEGEYGNFKPSTKAYKLQEFKRGFVRMAIESQSPIIPTLIIGAEETHINLRQLRFTKYLRGTVLPLPLNILPLPARWKIRFLNPIYLPYKPKMSGDRELVHEIANDIKGIIQSEINSELKNRNSVYF
jgi:1-acyl-sn-glycerol-3-phosphate acyltransferase